MFNGSRALISTTLLSCPIQTYRSCSCPTPGQFGASSRGVILPTEKSTAKYCVVQHQMLVAFSVEQEGGINAALTVLFCSYELHSMGWRSFTNIRSSAN